MGWKAVKEHYDIRHILGRYEGEGWCIGSPYVHALITIDTDARTIKPSSLIQAGDELDVLIRRFHADGEAFWSMWDTPDVFERALPVFTTREGVLVQAFCEDLGWPNATHDGWVMYDNTYFTDPLAAISDGKRDAEASIRYIEERLAQWEEEGARLRERLSESRERLSSLDQEERSLAVPSTSHVAPTSEQTP
jgi:hypothetical protein